MKQSRSDTTSMVIEIASTLISLLISVISSELKEKKESEANKDEIIRAIEAESKRLAHFYGSKEN